ncbi:MAG TPA: amidohydrolase family protein [Pseudonocardiaceae bacterium]|nr:amidohydrolase family protein [Pseudonocardiaceae bacterium]
MTSVRRAYVPDTRAVTRMYIDVHGHLAPFGETGGGPPSLRDPEAAIARKRELGVVMTIIGSPVGAGSMLPGTGVDNYTQSADQVRGHNELMGDLVDRFPDSLRAYAYVDPFGGDAMLAQAVDLLADQRFVGLITSSSVNGEFLGSPRAAGFFAMAAEQRVPVLLHPPAEPVGTAGIGPIGLVEHVARPCDVTMSVATIVCAGVLDRYPDLCLIAAAGGGGLAFLAEKLDLAMARTNADAPPLTTPSESLRRMYVETSCPSPVQLRANLQTFGRSHVLFGSDAPPVMAGLAGITEIVASSVLNDDELAAVAWRNAARVFGLPAKKHAQTEVR